MSLLLVVRGSHVRMRVFSMAVALATVAAAEAAHTAQRSAASRGVAGLGQQAVAATSIL